jgi:hypothetical protein
MATVVGKRRRRTRKLTEAEFMRLPDDGRKYELVDGEAKEVPTSFLHGVIGMRVAMLLQTYLTTPSVRSDKGTSLRFTSRRKTQNFTIYTQHTTPTLHHQRHQPQQQHTRAPTMPVP